MFGLTGETLASRIRAAASAAGLGDGYNGHSGRIGMARRMVAAGAPNATVQHQGRWRHGDMATWRHGGPVHPGRSGRGGAEVAHLASSSRRAVEEMNGG